MDELEVIIAESRHLTAEERGQRYFNFFISQGPRVTLPTLSDSSSSGSRTPIGLPSPTASDRGQPVNHQQVVMTQQNVAPPARDLESIQELEGRRARSSKPTQQASPPSSAGKAPSGGAEKQRSKLVRAPSRVTRSKVNASTPFVQLDISGKKVVNMANPCVVRLSSCEHCPEATKTSSMGLLGTRKSDHTPQLGQGNNLKRKRGADDDAANPTKRTRCETPSTISCIESNSLRSSLFTVEAHDGTPSRFASWLTDQEPEAYEPLDNDIIDYVLQPSRPVEPSIIMGSIEASQSIEMEEETQHIEEHDQNCDQTETSCSGTWTDVDPADDAAFFQSKRVQATTETSIQQYSKAASRKTRPRTDASSRSTRSSGVHKNRKITKSLEKKISLLSAYREIDAYCENIDLNIDVANKTRVIYHEIHGATFTNDKPLDALVASCILIAAETLEVPKKQLQKVVSLVDGPPLCVHVLKEIIEEIYPHIKEAGTVKGTA